MEIAIKCYNPVYVNGQFVACGKCNACIAKKSYINETKIKLECQNSYACLFVTLTYADEHIPMTEIVPTTTGILDVIDRCPHSPTHGERIDKVESIYDLDRLRKLTNHVSKSYYKKFPQYKPSYYMPSLSHYDVQKFMKRVRRKLEYHGKKYLNTQTSNKTEAVDNKTRSDKKSFTKIRMYAVGEYGPRTFRPHYHLLIFTNCEEQISLLEQILPSCWVYGRFDCQRARDAASYVAGYVSGYNNIPQILRTKTYKPFCSHSIAFGELTLPPAPREINSTTVRDFIVQSISCAGRTTDVRLWPSYIVKSFPRIRGYGKMSDNDVYRLYTFSNRVKSLREKFGSWFNVSKFLAINLLNDNYGYRLPNYQLLGYYADQQLIIKERCYELWKLLIDYKATYNLKLDYKDQFAEYEKLTNIIYSILLCSKKFLHLAKQNFSYSQYPERLMFNRINDFYSHVKLLQMSNFLDEQSLHTFDCLEDLDVELASQYYNYNHRMDVEPFIEAFKHHDNYNKLKYKFDNLSQEKMKHKVLNDLNKIWL